MVDPDLVVVQKLTGVAGLAAGVDLFRGRVRPAAAGVPVRAVFVEAQGGARNSRYLGTGRSVRDLSVQVRVRSEAGDSAGGRDLAVLVHAALDHVYQGLPTGYLDLRCDQPFPIELDQDELGAHEFSVNVTARFVG